MTTIWSKDGRRFPATILQLDRCQVTGHHYPNPKGGQNLHMLELGCGYKKNNINRALLGHFARAQVAPKRQMHAFGVPDKTYMLPLGTVFNAAWFKTGQFVDIRAVSKGKGFQGVMKRWGFSGGPASHGATKFHRRPGSIGGGQDPGRIWKGKKMPGRMGHQNVSIQGIQIAKVDPELDLIYLAGIVPGPNKGVVQIRDTIRGKLKPAVEYIA